MRRTSAYRSSKQDFWVKTKCWETGTFDLWGIKREPGMPAVGIVARGGKYAGSPTITLPKHAARSPPAARTEARAVPPAGAPRAIINPTVEWVKPGQHNSQGPAP